MSANPAPTNPQCTAARHLSARSYRIGCRCPEAVAARVAIRAVKREQEHARRVAIRNNLVPAKPVDLDEADRVVVERVIAKKLPFAKVKHPADRVAVVDTLARTSGPSTIARILNISQLTASELIRVAQASRVAA